MGLTRQRVPVVYISEAPATIGMRQQGTGALLSAVDWWSSNSEATKRGGVMVNSDILPCLVFSRKNFEREFFHFLNIKYELITKLITELICKLQDESNEHN